jgi:tetratricopeptide (TPR) repeat protein
MAVTHFARALGASRAGRPGDATVDIAKLAELRDKLREAKDAYWSGQVDIQWQIATAWQLNAGGKNDEALRAMSAAADAEDKTNVHPVMPGFIAPARELFGDMLLERGLSKEAFAAYQAAEASQPNRFRTLAGAAKAAEKIGDKLNAKAYYEKLIALAAGSDVDRSELGTARAFIASN